MNSFEWHYRGDVNLRHGGMYWREDRMEDHVFVAEVIPCSDAGGPDNLFHVRLGHLHIREDRDSREKALALIGVSSPEEATREELVVAFHGYHELNADEALVVRIGKTDPLWSGRGESPAPDVVLRSGTSLRKWMTREYLHNEPSNEPSSPQP